MTQQKRRGERLLWAWRDADGSIVPFTLFASRYECGMHNDPMRRNGAHWPGRIARVQVRELPRRKGRRTKR